MEAKLEIADALKSIEDHLFTSLKMTIRERSLYYHFLRHTRLIGRESSLFAIYPLAEQLGLSHSSVRESIREMDQKGCIKIDRTRQGHFIRVLLPDEIEGVLPTETAQEEVDIESLDFFQERRYVNQLIARENGACFYCLRKIRPDNCELDHVIPMSLKGDNSYRNIVASCHQCNTSKQGRTGEDFLRLLYRDEVLSQDDLKVRLHDLEELRAGKRIPQL
jgi:5-methylcytosine-specific restriction endonuclease McrA